MACCAATKALWMLTFVSRVNSSRVTANGSSGGEKVPWLTVEC
jgi:hypothetical protein